MKFSTKAVHAGRECDPTTGAILSPIYQTATYVLPEIGESRGFDYSRSSNPTRETLEKALAELENGKFGVCFSSGMAAVDSVFRTFSAGDHLIIGEDVYGGVFRLSSEILTRHGFECTYVDTTDVSNIVEAIRPNTKLIWIETPTNPLIKISDVEAVAKLGKEKGILTGIDSTFATPYHLRPLEYGIDIVLHSTTKYISGHNQLIGGVCITDNEEIYEQLKFMQKSVGAVPSPFDCWLTLLGMATLELRMKKHSENGIAVAKYLESHPKIESIAYPGLESHPQYAIAKKILKGGFSGMMSFEVKGGYDAGVKLMNSVKLCALAESLGAVETMITHPASMTHVSVPKEIREERGLTDSLVRLSVGIEDVEDIISDLDKALELV